VRPDLEREHRRDRRAPFGARCETAASQPYFLDPLRFAVGALARAVKSDSRVEEELALSNGAP
jgi:hypothetical protein